MAPEQLWKVAIYPRDRAAAECLVYVNVQSVGFVAHGTVLEITTWDSTKQESYYVNWPLASIRWWMLERADDALFT